MSEIESLPIVLRWKHLGFLKNFSMTVLIGETPIFCSPDPGEARAMAKMLARWKGISEEIPELNHWTLEQESLNV